MSSNENSFLFLSSHRNKYFEKMKNLVDKDKNPDYIGYILKDVFFSAENIDIIQKQLILSVYNKEKIIIPYQNYVSLKVVMRYIFSEYSQNLPFKIKDQVRDLNKRLVDELTPMVIKNANVKLKYLEDSQNPHVPIDLPININSSGNKTLPSFTSTF